MEVKGGEHVAQSVAHDHGFQYIGHVSKEKYLISPIFRPIKVIKKKENIEAVSLKIIITALKLIHLCTFFVLKRFQLCVKKNTLSYFDHEGYINWNKYRSSLGKETFLALHRGMSFWLQLL